MEYRPFGQTGLAVSVIGFGCWEIGGGYGSIEAQDFDRATQGLKPGDRVTVLLQRGPQSLYVAFTVAKG